MLAVTSITVFCVAIYGLSCFENWLAHWPVHRKNTTHGRHSARKYRFWTVLFRLNCIKNSRNASAFREFSYLFIRKITISKLLCTWKRWEFVPDKEKSTGILGGLRAFLTQYGANLHHFQAIIPYGVSPNAHFLLFVVICVHVCHQLVAGDGLFC